MALQCRLQPILMELISLDQVAFFMPLLYFEQCVVNTQGI